MRFKKLLRLWIAGCVVVMAGCIKDDRSGCYIEGNFELIFEYSAVSPEKFPDYIHCVDVVFFDVDGYFLLHKQVKEQDLDDYRGLKVTLDPGTYYIIAWANILDNSTLFWEFTSEVIMFEDCLLKIREDAESGDQVYYAPKKDKPDPCFGNLPMQISSEMELYKVVIPYMSNVTHTLDFTRAHRSIYVWIEGYNDLAQGVNLCPTVEVTNLWDSYDFHFRTQDTRRDFIQKGRETECNGVVYSLSTFHHAYGKIDTEMIVNVYRTSNGEFMQAVNVKKFVDDYPAMNTDDIHILISFLDDLGVIIRLPEWIEKEVTPGIE